MSVQVGLWVTRGLQHLLLHEAFQMPTPFLTCARLAGSQQHQPLPAAAADPPGRDGAGRVLPGELQVEEQQHSAHPWHSAAVSLRPHADRALLPQLQPYIDRMLYTVCLTWVHSEHYNTPSRIIVILQEICNLLIEMVRGVAQGAEPHAWCAGLQGTTGCSWGSPCPRWLFSPSQTRNFLSPEEVMKGLQGELDETLENVKLSISTIEKLFQSYDHCCSDLLPSLFTARVGMVWVHLPPPRCADSPIPPQEKEPQLWEFPRSLVFRRMDAFLHRLRTIEVGTQRCGHRGGNRGAKCSTASAQQELYETAMEFLKLEKAELGGVRGNILGHQVLQVYEEVSELTKEFADCKYDPLDPEDEVSGCWDGRFASPLAGRLHIKSSPQPPLCWRWGQPRALGLNEPSWSCWC